MAYFRGKFGKLELAQDAQTYHDVRSLVLTRVLGSDVAVEVEGLSRRLNAPVSSVNYALTRLVGENLVFRDPARGYVVRSVDLATSDDAHDAKLAIELGAAELTVGRLDADQLAEYRRLAVATGAHLTGGHLADVGSYIAANAEFHVYPIRVTGIRALAEAYDRLSLPELMSRVLTPEVEVSSHLIDDHRELVDAYERADLSVVKQIITAHNERAKATQRAGIERAGGRV